MSVVDDATVSIGNQCFTLPAPKLQVKETKSTVVVYAVVDERRGRQRSCTIDAVLRSGLPRTVRLSKRLGDRRLAPGIAGAVGRWKVRT